MHISVMSQYDILPVNNIPEMGVSTIQMYSSMSTITLNMHEYEYSENKCTRVRLLYNVIMITFMITLMNILFLT